MLNGLLAALLSFVGVPDTCAALPVQGRPPFPLEFIAYDDSAYVIPDPAGVGGPLYRRLAMVEFNASATDAQVRSFFIKFRACVLGGSAESGIYVVRFPDPGASWAALDAILTAMNDEPGVEVAAEVQMWNVKSVDGTRMDQ